MIGKRRNRNLNLLIVDNESLAFIGSDTIRKLAGVAALQIVTTKNLMRTYVQILKLLKFGTQRDVFTFMAGNNE